MFEPVRDSIRSAKDHCGHCSGGRGKGETGGGEANKQIMLRKVGEKLVQT